MEKTTITIKRENAESLWKLKSMFNHRNFDETLEWLLNKKEIKKAQIEIAEENIRKIKEGLKS